MNAQYGLPKHAPFPHLLQVQQVFTTTLPSISRLIRLHRCTGLSESCWAHMFKLNGSRGEPVSCKTRKKTIDYCKKGQFKSFVFIIFVVLMENRISEYAPGMKVLIFADLIYYHIVIVKNTLAQYFDNHTSNCMPVFSTMTILLCIS